MGHAFEEKDLELLAKTMKLRERMMDNISSRPEADLPSKPSDVMAVTNLLESVDRSIYAKAKINIDDSSSKNEEATREVLRTLMIDLHTQKTSLPILQAIGQTPSYKSRAELTVNSGELITKTDNYNPED